MLLTQSKHSSLHSVNVAGKAVTLVRKESKNPSRQYLKVREVCEISKCYIRHAEPCGHIGRLGHISSSRLNIVRSFDVVRCIANDRECNHILI